jgi:hypothetical protein
MQEGYLFKVDRNIIEVYKKHTVWPRNNIFIVYIVILRTT